MSNLEISQVAASVAIDGATTDRGPKSAAPNAMAQGFYWSGANGLSLMRVVDVVASLALLLFTLPLLLVIAAAVWLSDGGSPLFAQVRMGRGGRRFKCLKFRSMAVDADAQLRALLASNPAARFEWETTQKLRSDPRITRVGAFLRKSSLDELPQLINVLLGQMSIVGPRPIVASEIARYGRSYRYYCMVQPGITGLWQVSGRNDVSYGRRVALDRLYARSKSFSFDATIMFRTVPAVLLAKGSC